MFSYYSNYRTIIRAFKKNDILGVAFFQKGSYFVGYKAGVRICELVKDGYLERTGVDTIGNKMQHFANYRITEKGKQLVIPEPSFKEKLLHFINYV